MHLISKKPQEEDSSNNEKKDLTKNKIHLMSKYLQEELKSKKNFFTEDARLTKFHFQKFCLAELCCALFSSIGISLSIIAYDLGFISEGGFSYTTIVLDVNQGDEVKNLLLWLVAGSTVILWPLVVIRYYLKIKWLKSRNLNGDSIEFSNNKDIFFIILELLLVSMIPNPFLTNESYYSFNEVENIDVKYTINDVFSLLVLLRIILLIRIFMVNTVYYSNGSHRICELYGCESNYLYVTKCLIRIYPLRVTLFSMISCVFLGGYALKICERPLMNLMKETNQVESGKTFFQIDIANYYNAIWCIVVTMATVGYGDFAPKTLTGRIIGFFACISGSISVSLLVLTLQNLLSLNSSETKMMSIIDRIVIKKSRKKEAAYALLYFTKLIYLGKTKKKIDWKEIKKNVRKMKFHLHKFNQQKNALKIFDENVEFYESMKKQFEFLNKDFEILKEKCFILTEINKIICENKLKTPARKSSQDYLFGFDSVQESEEKNSFKKIPSKNMEAETPLLNSLMRHKRIREYKEKTLLIQNNKKN